mmetsp:Transcript_2691/g.6028  ORF Transcript_2691/g.6028 Transcript_2691/m.6028 type:complete len:246 (-) Transcript_2691:278-1015(-)
MEMRKFISPSNEYVGLIDGDWLGTDVGGKKSSLWVTAMTIPTTNPITSSKRIRNIRRLLPVLSRCATAKTGLSVSSTRKAETRFRPETASPIWYCGKLPLAPPLPPIPLFESSTIFLSLPETEVSFFSETTPASANSSLRSSASLGPEYCNFSLNVALSVFSWDTPAVSPGDTCSAPGASSRPGCSEPPALSLLLACRVLRSSAAFFFNSVTEGDGWRTCAGAEGFVSPGAVVSAGVIASFELGS